MGGGVERTRHGEWTVDLAALINQRDASGSPVMQREGESMHAQRHHAGVERAVGSKQGMQGKGRMDGPATIDTAPAPCTRV